MGTRLLNRRRIFEHPSKRQPCSLFGSEVVNDGVNKFFIVLESFEIDIASKALDFWDCVEDVLDPESTISRWHLSLPAGCVLSRLA